MKILVVGSGGRCHAIIDSLAKSRKVDKIFAAPGNAGISKLATIVDIKETDKVALLDFVKENKIDLTVIGPEAALATGITNLLSENGFKVFGPSKEAAMIESSKEFAKKLMKKYDIPTAAYEAFSDYDLAISYVKKMGVPIVIKYDGLAAGKGVVVAMSFKEADEALIDMLKNDKFGHGRVVIEEYLEGPEFSFMCLVSNDKVYPLEMSQDHKRAYDNDMGPNTGGMGAYSPLPFITKSDFDFAYNEIMKRTAIAMISEGVPFKGVLYGGLMKTKSGIKVIEFNARFGDPETEVVLPRLKSDLCEVFMDIIDDKDPKLVWDTDATIGIVMASKGYPNDYQKGFLIEGADIEGIYHMGTKLVNGKYYTNGGRVLLAVGKGKTLAEANKVALEKIKNIKCDNLFYRTDIGAKANKV